MTKSGCTWDAVRGIPSYALFAPTKAAQRILAQSRHDLLMSCADDAGVNHILKRIADKDSLSSLQSLLREKTAIIADGHHRYTTALEYRKSHSEADRVMVCLVNAYDRGMAILPTNRIFSGKLPKMSAFDDWFTLQKHEDSEKLFSALESEKKVPCFGLAVKKDYFLLLLKNKSLHASSSNSHPLTSLPVALLHELVFSRILGLSPEDQRPPLIRPVKGNQETLSTLSNGETAFFVRPPSMEDMLAMAAANELMPQKSTFFYPKLFSGLVFHLLEDTS